MTVIATPALTRTLWLRQHLVPEQRWVSDIPGVVEHLIGLQAQDTLPPYLAIAARVDNFSPTDLSALLADRTLVRFFSVRGTVHVLSAQDALGLRGWVQPALDRRSTTDASGAPTTAKLERATRAVLTEGSRPLNEIAATLHTDFPDISEEALKRLIRERLPLVQAPPRGLWKQSGGVAYAFADTYLGDQFVDIDVETLVLRYLAAYGPATPADMTTWSMVTHLGPVFAAMHREGRLNTYRDSGGRVLYDLPGAPIAEDLDLPVTLLGKYDNLFLSHADRARIAPDTARKRWMGPNGGVASTVFIDGLLAGLWRVIDGRVSTELFTTPTKTQRRQLQDEIERIESLLAVPAD